MIRSLCSLLFGRPLYHLFVGGAVQVCDRFSFVAAWMYLFALGACVRWLLNGAHVLMFKLTGYPLDECFYRYLKPMDATLQTNLQDYYHAHEGLLSGMLFGFKTFGFVLALFVVWRVLMLVIQRANATRFSATWVLSLTLLVAVAGWVWLGVSGSNPILMSIPGLGMLGWVAVLALIPPRERVVPEAETRLGRWVARPLYQIFTSSLQERVDRLTFVLAYVWGSIYCGLLALVWVKLVTIGVFVEDHFRDVTLDGMLCRWTGIGVAFEGMKIAFVPRDVVAPHTFILQPLQSFSANVAWVMLYALLLFMMWRVFVLIVQRMRDCSGVSLVVGCFIGGVILLLPTVYALLAADGSLVWVDILLSYGALLLLALVPTRRMTL